jgi:hypothetical protein
MPVLVRSAALAALVFIALAITPAKAHDEFTSWAETAQKKAYFGGDKSWPMAIEDRFTVRLAAGGTKAETACSGSRWVYDYVHHIAAGYDGGPQMILYVGKPPIKLPSRDLSHVSTIRGIHLGESPEHVAAALKVPLSDVARASKHRQFLYLSKPVHLPGDTHIFYDLSMIVFDDGRAVSIWLAHNEN